MVEIYLEKIRDLLLPHGPNGSVNGSVNGSNLRIYEVEGVNVVDGMHEEQVGGPAQHLTAWTALERFSNGSRTTIQRLSNGSLPPRLPSAPP
jgi:hypothetical protein